MNKPMTNGTPLPEGYASEQDFAMGITQNTGDFSHRSAAKTHRELMAQAKIAAKQAGFTVIGGSFLAKKSSNPLIQAQYNTRVFVIKHMMDNPMSALDHTYPFSGIWESVYSEFVTYDNRLTDYSIKSETVTELKEYAKERDIRTPRGSYSKVGYWVDLVVRHAKELRMKELEVQSKAQAARIVELEIEKAYTITINQETGAMMYRGVVLEATPKGYKAAGLPMVYPVKSLQKLTAFLDTVYDMSNEL